MMIDNAVMTIDPNPQAFGVMVEGVLTLYYRVCQTLLPAMTLYVCYYLLGKPEEK